MKILVLDVPALRLHYLGCYGNEWVATPNIDRIASEGVVFDRHYAETIDPTLKSLWRPESSPELPVEWLDDASLPCSTDSFLEAAEHLRGALERCSSGDQWLVWARWPCLAPPWLLPQDMLDAYCEEDDEFPWPDPPAGPLEDEENLLRLQSTYAAVVTFVDARIGDVVDYLREEGVLDDLLLIVTSSIGLPLGEHRQVGYEGVSLHEELVHLPLLMRLPGAVEAGHRIRELTQPSDVVSFLARSRNAGDGPCGSEHFQTRSVVLSRAQWGGEAECSVRTTEWAYLSPLSTTPGDSPRSPRLFLKPADPYEVNDLRQQHMDVAEEMEKQLRHAFAATDRM